ncbi:hypothetical protein OG786_29030 [Streptomyces sp. NBC_00101]|uniref:hypothetical protein n=1 Tax=Streptomyces sp. NBC_00101 TaxID=2975651 RepID=UPI00324FB5DA
MPQNPTPATAGDTNPTDLTPFVPRTEREYWVAITNALNAAVAAGMPIGIDLDGTLTDHNAWSVVWDREAERWALAGYDDDSHEAKVREYLSTPYTDDAPSQREAGAALRRSLPEEDSGRCLTTHPFNPRDGWRLICGSCDHARDASCHREAGAL